MGCTYSKEAVVPESSAHNNDEEVDHVHPLPGEMGGTMKHAFGNGGAGISDETPKPQVNYLSHMLNDFPHSPDTPNTPSTPGSPSSPAWSMSERSPGYDDYDHEASPASPPRNGVGSGVTPPPKSGSGQEGNPIVCETPVTITSTITSGSSDVSTPNSILSTMIKDYPHSPDSPLTPESLAGGGRVLGDSVTNMSYLPNNNKNLGGTSLGGVKKDKMPLNAYFSSFGGKRPNSAPHSPSEEDVSESSYSVGYLDKFHQLRNGKNVGCQHHNSSAMTASTKTATSFGLSDSAFGASSTLYDAPSSSLSSSSSQLSESMQQVTEQLTQDDDDHSMAGLRLSLVDHDNSILAGLEEADLLWNDPTDASDSRNEEDLLFSTSPLLDTSLDDDYDNDNPKRGLYNWQSSGKQREEKNKDTQKDRSNRRLELQTRPVRRGMGTNGLARKTTNDSNTNTLDGGVGGNHDNNNENKTPFRSSDAPATTNSAPNTKKRKSSSGKIHGKLDKKLKQYAEQFRKILTRYPLGGGGNGGGSSGDQQRSQRTKFQEKDVREMSRLMEEYPEICHVKYDFVGTSDAIYPLPMFCGIDAPVEVLRICHDACPKQIKDQDIYIGSPLHYAIHYGASKDVLEFLLDECPKIVKAKNHFGRSGLHLLCMQSSSSSSTTATQAQTQQQQQQQKQRQDCYNHSLFEKASLLLSRDKSLASRTEKDEYMPLHFAASHRSPLEVIQYLMEVYPLACIAKTKLGFTPLHIAIQSDAPTDVVKAMIKAGPKALKAVDNANQLPLHIAVNVWAKLSTIKLLYRVYPEAAKKENSFGKTPLDIAKTKKNSQTIVKILKTPIQQKR